MKENEKIFVGGIISLAFIFLPGFLIHVSPRFPGSFEGGMLGILGALLMLTTLLYPLCKRLAWLRRRVSMRIVLLVHIFAGVFGALLALLHTGHKMESPIGIAMIVLLVIVLVSGFLGRYYMSQVVSDLRAQRAAEGTLLATYVSLAAEMAAGVPSDGRAANGLWRRWAPFWLGHEGNGRRQLAAASVARRAVRVVEAIADTQYAIAAQEAIKCALAIWTTVHIAATIGLFGLLGLHVWSSVYFGLRWLAW